MTRSSRIGPEPRRGGEPPAFTREDVRRAFDPASLRRGEALARAGCVLGLDWSGAGRMIEARVRGSRPRPYRVSVSVGHALGPRRQTIFAGSCTCPVGFNCKHAAAVLLALLDDAEGAAVAPVDPLAGPVGAWLDRIAATAARTPGSAAMDGDRVLYLLDPRDDRGREEGAVVRVIVARPLKAGGHGSARSYGIGTLAASSARFVTAEDSLIGQLLGGRGAGYSSDLPNDPVRLGLAFERIVATGRCHFRDKDSPPLSLGPARPARLGWQIGPQGEQHPAIEVEAPPGLVVLRCAAPWYVDPAAAQAGPLHFEAPPALVAAFLEAPPLAPGQGSAVRAVLDQRLPGRPIPPPRQDLDSVTLKEPPVPVLVLRTRLLGGPHGYPPPVPVDMACLSIEYGGTPVAPGEGPTELRRREGERLVLRPRDPKAEKAAVQRLGALGLALAPFRAVPPGAGAAGPYLALRPASPDQAAWLPLVHHDVPKLRAEGWRVEIEPGFRFQVVETTGDWEASFGEKSAWWFSLELGVEVEGQRVPLLPILVELVRAGVTPEALAEANTAYAPLPDGRMIALPTERVRPLLETLIELHDSHSLDEDGRLDIPLGEAEALARIAEATKLRWLGDRRLVELAAKLRDAGGALDEAEPPPGLRAELRPYQRRGLAWMALLAEHGLGGVLADDMGLGKTVQTLAHLLAEKAAGRLDRPALVVCPTSLVGNWEREAARFAPGLRVLRLHGRERGAGFGRIAEADLVLSTYALLPRDEEALLPVEWSLAVLDEAQAIKNPRSQAAQSACRLKAGHRLCLTGTPIENHLGELYSQFSFLMPGLLGDARRFNRLFRTPIEKRGDAERRAALAGRLRPFLLRRTKDQVAPELPPRTEILRRVALTGAQRDLYETVRLAMHDRIRREIAARGFERSRIVVLDALLKLRQVCCDPRLVKLRQAERVKESAKLAELLEDLPQMIEEGRRVLLFSQFTSMLDLIGPAVRRAGVPFVELRGDTVDRATPVARFQGGEVPLFLLSLKAGGVGLNLTAADTVILYDPWWNPAVEAQAADRAHRIGQDKPVFIYKLIAEGTIEERMLDLQSRKRALAGGLLDDEAGGFTGFAEADLDLLLRPIG